MSIRKGCLTRSGKVKKKSGILLHITSLFSEYGIGDIGPSARRFADFLAASGQSLWQILPLNPTDQSHGNSPYSSISAFAGNTLLISPELMAKDGFIAGKDIRQRPEFSAERVDYGLVGEYKKNILELAYRNFKAKRNKAEYEKFCSLNAYWLDDFSLFAAVRTRFDGKPWYEWPEGLRGRNPGELKAAGADLKDERERIKFFQYLFSRQWSALKAHCAKRKVSIIGDMPIYVNLDSADAWKNPGIFKLDKAGKPCFVAGVPPDYFSKTGQIWGNPVYDWDALKSSGYAWWIMRMRRMLEILDMVRVDHFRGFVGYWQIPAGEKTGVNGKWEKAPAEDFFAAMLGKFPKFPIIAEDLGIITPDVKAVMERFGFPGMKVLLFAFGEDNPRHPYLPRNYDENCVVYTGTHDNNTARGWFRNEAGDQEKKRFFEYIGGDVPEEEVAAKMTELAMNSPAAMAMIPMQDILNLDESARMNTPAVTSGNWEWRLLPEQLNPSLAKNLRKITKNSGRCVRG
ncbi:MAG: 4-alpha-glucanotransferase [Candidatus Omnitrophica bacterium]|nr:4-alpha-glucanotransferase [Candidatus Omnitrophota bacterium]